MRSHHSLFVVHTNSGAMQSRKALVDACFIRVISVTVLTGSIYDGIFCQCSLEDRLFSVYISYTEGLQLPFMLCDTASRYSKNLQYLNGNSFLCAIAMPEHVLDTCKNYATYLECRFTCAISSSDRRSLLKTWISGTRVRMCSVAIPTGKGPRPPTGSNFGIR